MINHIIRDLGLEQQVCAAEDLPEGKSREVFHVLLRACSTQGCYNVKVLCAVLCFGFFSRFFPFFFKTILSGASLPIRQKPCPELDIIPSRALPSAQPPVH